LDPIRGIGTGEQKKKWEGGEERAYGKIRSN